MAKRKEVKPERARVLKDLQVLVPQDDEAASQYPLLIDLLLPRYEGEQCTRQGATVRIKANGTCWMVSIECPSEGMQTALGLSTLHDFCAQVERQLGGSQLNWAETWQVQKKRRQARGG